MADTEVTEEVELTSFDGDEVFYVVDDPGGTPADRKSTHASVIKPVAFPCFPAFAVDANMYLTTPSSSYTAGAMTAGRLYMSAIWVPRSRQYTTYAAVLTTLSGTAGIRLGLYNADQDTGQPATKIDEGATQIDASAGTGATGRKTVAFGANQTLKAGLYFLAALSDGGPSVIRTGPSVPFLGATFTTNSVIGNAALYRDSVTYGALPADESGSTFLSISSAGTQMPTVGIR